MEATIKNQVGVFCSEDYEKSSHEFVYVDMNKCNFEVAASYLYYEQLQQWIFSSVKYARAW